MACATCGTKTMYIAKTCPYLTLTTVGLDWEEDRVEKSMMLDFMAIPHVPHIKAIISTSRGTNDCGGYMFIGGLDACNSHASHGQHQPWVKIISKETALGCSCKQKVGMSRRNYHKHDLAPFSPCNRSTTASRCICDHENCG